MSLSSPEKATPDSSDVMQVVDGLEPALRGTHWRHKKTNGKYTIVGQCMIEATATAAYLYQGHDGRIWARPKDEFMDGRFERLDDEEPASA